jgi:glucuronate isomerase
VAPSLRGDNLLEDPEQICRWLEAQWGEPVTDLDSLRLLLLRRLKEFHLLGCRFADHALDADWSYVPDDKENPRRFASLRKGLLLSDEDKVALQSHILRILAELYSGLGWVMQLHLGASRFTSTRLRSLVGPAGGFAGIGTVDVEGLIRMLDDLEQCDCLPRTILYTMDRSILPRLAILSGSFTRAGEPGYVQLGPAWWWCDHIRGMEDTLDTVMGYGLLSAFIGMTTDSRSLLSFSRHSYFRAVLCAWLAKQSQAGVITENFRDLSALVKAMCFENANRVLTERNR